MERSAAARLADPKATFPVADHEPIVVEVLERCLRRDGFRVVTASTAQEAWDAVLVHEREGIFERSRGLVEAHAGHIWTESSPLGAPAFWFRVST